MNSANEVVDEIRAFLQSNDQTFRNELRDLASTFAEACTEVNQRLQKCNRLLQQGLRSEAIHLAEAEPKLLDVLAVLDFPERAGWDEIVQLYQLSAAPALGTTIAEYLNEAYAQENPLQDLLRSHRRLALARGPLRPRIEVMRKIAAVDWNNPIWIEDIRTFEKVRRDQIKNEAIAATNGRDLSRLQELLIELTSTSWSDGTTGGLADKVKAAIAQIRGLSARETIKILEVELNDAFAAFDIARGRAAREKWNEVVGPAALPANHPILDRSEPALLWLADQDRREQQEHDYESAIRELEEALDDDADRAELQQLGHAVLRFDRDMPDTLAARFKSRVEGLELAETRRSRLILAAGVAAVALIGGLAFFAIRQQRRANDAAQVAATVEKMLSDKQLEQATSFLDNLTKSNASILGEPAVVEAGVKLKEAQAKDRERIDQFTSALHSAETAKPAALDPPALQLARSLARLEAEKAAVEHVAATCEAAFREERARRDEAALPRINALSVKIASLEREAAKADSRAVIAEPLHEIQAELAKLNAELPYLSEHLRLLVGVFVKKTDALQKEEKLIEQGTRLENDITHTISYSRTESLGDLALFTGALQAFIKASPNSPRAETFKKTLEEYPGRNAVFAWHQLAASWLSNPAKLTVKAAKERSVLCTRFLSDHPRFPDAAILRDYQKHLDAIARRDDSDDAPRKRLQKLFSDLFVDNLWTVTIRRGRLSQRYYVARKPEDGFDEFRYLKNFDGKEETLSVNVGETPRVEPAPQSNVATQVKVRLANDAILDDWDANMVAILRSVSTEPNIDPILRLVLIDKVMTYAGEGSEPLRRAFSLPKNLISVGDVDTNVTWMDPEDDGAGQSRPRAAELLKALPDPTIALRDAEKQRAAIEAQVSYLPYPVGWLLKDEKGWHCRTGKALPKEGDLCVVVPDGEKDGVWRKVGTLSNSGLELVGANNSNLVEGRPVFVVTRSSNRP